MDIREILAKLSDLSTLTGDELRDYRKQLSDYIHGIDPASVNAETLADMTKANESVQAINQTLEVQAQVAQIQASTPTEFPEPEAPEPVEAPAATVETPAAEAPAPEAPATVPAPATVEPAPAPTPVTAATPAPDPGAGISTDPATLTPSTPAFALTASADIPQVPAGTQMGLVATADALMKRVKNFSGPAPRGFEKVPVAFTSWELPEERQLSLDAVENSKKIGKVVNEMVRLNNEGAFSGDTYQNPLTAAGGMCAPLSPDYSFLNISTDARPVRDGLPSFQSVRGGIRFNDPIAFTTYNDAITVWDNQDDIDALTDSEVRKNCLRIDCGDETEVRIEAIVTCLTFGNLGAMTYPELVADAISKSAVAHARTAEQRLLEQMDANSLVLTYGPVLSATRDVLFALNKYIAGFRYRNRTSSDFTLDLLVPAWLKNLLVADLSRQMPGDDTLAKAEAEVMGYLTNAGYRVFTTIDANPRTGAGDQTWAAETTNSEINDFPTKTRVRVFHPGAHVFLDQGQLDLGVVRDSTLNAANDYQIFMETFEGLASPGFEPAVIDFTICPNGTASDVSDPPVCGAGGS